MQKEKEIAGNCLMCSKKSSMKQTFSLHEDGAGHAKTQTPYESDVGSFLFSLF